MLLGFPPREALYDIGANAIVKVKRLLSFDKRLHVVVCVKSDLHIPPGDYHSKLW